MRFDRDSHASGGEGILKRSGVLAMPMITPAFDRRPGLLQRLRKEGAEQARREATWIPAQDESFLNRVRARA